VRSDIEVRDADGDMVQVELRGVDVYDPTTGAVRSKSPKEIALWLIDTNYNEEAFFVRHGENDPYKNLRVALNADIDPDPWTSLYSTTSNPFVRPSTGKIAVKIIDDYGDEVMKVFDV
jgi:adenine-specific DNA-methyltransferase